ncbi:hypothetical protein EU527_16910 [Candidatus Thorarchaeota archaeon]|nr:MAG: hypothetical protein EU527_16910 [Candidatus Thorarchaeota archaeon]
MKIEKWKFTALAVILVCLMVSCSFIGFLDSTYRLTLDNRQNSGVVDETLTSTLDDIPLRMSTDFVYDSESDKAIFFGGATENLHADYEDTWSYDFNTNTWTNMSPSVNPPASDFNQMVYHSGEDKVVLFGGHVSGAADNWLNHNETWTYDYNTNTWTDMDPVLAPPAIAGGCMAYDSESNLIVLFAGSTNDWVEDGMISETWTYDLGTNTWTNVTTSSQPSPRSWSSLAYDIESDYIVLHGGWTTEGSGWSILTDTWTYDTNINTWTEISVVGPTILGDFAYDSESDLIVFWGGTADMNELVEDLRSETWTYDTNTETWEQMVNEVKPPVRSRGELVYDSESDKILLFGGILDGGWETEEVVHDCWSYDLNNNLWNNVDWDWQEMTPINSPGTRTGSPLVYDIESDRMVVFSGWDNLYYSGSRYNDTFTYDYNMNTWTNMSPATQPTGRGGHAMAYSQRADTIVMFGGSIGHQTAYDKFNAETWTYDLNTNTWTNKSPSNNPSPRAFASLTYDNKSDVFVLFGGWPGGWGNAYHDTWIYNLTSNTWTNVTTSIHPAGSLLASMMYDYKDDRILLIGGNSWEEFNNEIWVYNVTDNLWTELIATTLGPQFGIGLAFDLQSDLIVATGGPLDLDESIFVSETWIYNLTSGQWNTTYSPNNPPHRSRMSLAYDIESDRIIMYGGALPDGTEGDAIGDTWAYDYRVNPVMDNYGPPELDITVDDNELILTWTPPEPVVGISIQGYNIYRGDVSSEYELIAELGNVLTYTDKTAGFGITYHYAVSALSENGEGELSNEEIGLRQINKHDNGIFNFIVYGDTRAGDDSAVAAIHNDLVSHYLQHDPEMIIHSGDMVYHGGEAEQWPLFDASISAIADWDSEIEFFGAVGNHEWYTNVYGVTDEDFSAYRDYFDFSSVIDEEGETELNYAFDRQGIHFVILNTVNDWTDETYTCPTTQMEWLEADLAEEHNFTIVITHYPSYSILVDRPDRLAQAASLREEFEDLFTPDSVDIVFSGHNHYYYRTVRDGVYYITAAGGGAPLYESDTVDTDWISGDIRSEKYHYCVCSLNEGDLVIQVIALDGIVIDSMTFTDAVQYTSTNTTGGIDQSTMIMYVVIISVVAVVIIVVVLFIKKKK